MSAQSLAVILAAGKGTRMRSSIPKVMHKVGGLAMVDHVLAAARAANVRECALVVGPDSDWAEKRDGAPSVFIQEEQKGTAHAVLAARSAVGQDHDAVVILFGDSPLITGATISRVLARVHSGADLALLAFRTADPTGYGRILMEDEKVAAIREERDATDAERAITLCNSGVMAVCAGTPFDAIAEIESDNAKGEFYLTDLVALGQARGFVMEVEEAPFEEVMGVNDRAQLAAAEAAFQARARAAALAHATLEAPDTVFFSHDTVLGQDAHVEPHVVFSPGVRVGEGARIRAFSHLEGAMVAAGAVVGPYARLRPGADIGQGAKVGNFVEIKNAVVAAGAKVNHLSYVGDASIGAGANIGAGVITCNYDGKNKFLTTVEAGAFVGSNSALVAPVTIGERGYVASGSVITDDVPSEALAFGRARQVVKEGRSPARQAAPAPSEKA
ncbi:MAG: bifunctional UDP-N-acetylglucosamine diphosphorylase/glucosamine-1-phosphate N-acetyltransferase GlmU [Pseudomonadota bacterium]